MKSLEFIKALRSGKHVFGTLIISTEQKLPGILATLGPDFVFIDTEHIALYRNREINAIKEALDKQKTRHFLKNTHI